LAGSGKKYLKVWDSAVVDIGIRLNESPIAKARVSVEVQRHIMINELLQVNAETAIGSNHYVGAYSDIV
jgi:hypothetical protein